MQFIDRVSLGKSLAGQLLEYRGKDAVIICLKESSLLTCLTMAMELRAWVYPLLSERIYSNTATAELLGAVDEDAAFHNLPDRAQTAETIAMVEDKRLPAARLVKERLDAYSMPLNEHTLDGRDVIIAGDIVLSTLELSIATQLAAACPVKSISIAIGNATAEVADTARIHANKTVLLDILSGVTFDDEQYFERPDSYTLDERRTITQNIATYWQ